MGGRLPPPRHRRSQASHRKSNASLHHQHLRPPVPAHIIDNSSPLYSISPLLAHHENILLLGDFNLHHPSWSRTSEICSSKMADDLINIAEENDLHLITPKGLITWERCPGSRSSSTLDLTYLSEPLLPYLEMCKLRDDLHHGSNHRPVVKHLSFPTLANPDSPAPKRLW